MHQHIVLLTIITDDTARISEEERFKLEKLDHGFCRIIGRYGFMEQPDVPALLIAAGLIHTVEHTTFFLGRENLVGHQAPGHGALASEPVCVHVSQRVACDQVLQHSAGPRDGDWRADRTLSGSIAVAAGRFRKPTRSRFGLAHDP